MSEKIIDPSKPIRTGEELDVDKLRSYLLDVLGNTNTNLEIEQFPGGYSNLTYLLKMGSKEYVLRRPPFGRKIKSAHDMGREYRILSKLVEVYSRAPRPVAYCEDEEVLGAPFYIMERIRGVILRTKPPKGIDLTPDLMQRLSENFIDNLADIHSIDYQAAGLGDLGKPEGYVERQVTGWAKRYRDAQTDDLPQIDEMAVWLAKHMPPERGAALIHNDYKYDNLLLNPNDLSEIIGVLDWEMATLGDPLMDLGTTLSYWVTPDDPPELQTNAFGLTILPGNLSRAQLVNRYAERTGRDIPDLLYYYVYALFKLAVIAQQIYARYKAGDSQDARFARFIDLVQLMGQIGTRALELERIDNLS